MKAHSPQLILTSWLDDENGIAKLSPVQLQLLAQFNKPIDSDTQSQDKELFVKSIDNSSPTDLFIKTFEPNWEPNEILKMFHEEKGKIVYRGEECKKLLENADSVLKDVLALRDIYYYVSPKTSQLHSQCKNIIEERSDLKDSFNKISTTLSKQEELRSIFKRLPDIKNQISSKLKSVLQGYQTSQINVGAPLDEYYGRFFIECGKIKQLIQQLETCLQHSRKDELLLHLEEVYTLYFDVREQIIEPVFERSLEALVAKADRNYCDLLQQSSASLIRILRNEIQLFEKIFSSETSDPAAIVSNSNQSVRKQMLQQFLESLCRIFYEHLRPVVIRVNHLETLAELYKMAEVTKDELTEESFQSTLTILAQDIQERMVFRTEIFIEENIRAYNPSSGDLAYPEKLELVPGGQLKDFHSMWYPTVQRAVLALTYLSRVVDRLTFEELACDIYEACLKSLDVAQRLIDERYGGTKIEATLFLSKHLEILQEQWKSSGLGEMSSELQRMFEASAFYLNKT